MIPTRGLTGTYANVLGAHDMLSGESPSRAYREPLKRLARGVAFALVGALSFGASPAEGISKEPTTKQYISSIANKQLTDKQYKCHQEIIYRESRWDERAIGNIGGSKQAYGLYQLKIESMRTAHIELQFWKYWEYVAHRYGVTEYDEPMYCAALTHLKRKGWQ